MQRCVGTASVSVVDTQFARTPLEAACGLLSTLLLLCCVTCRHSRPTACCRQVVPAPPAAAA